MFWNFENTYAKLPDAFFQRLKPTPVSHPKIILWNDNLARELGLQIDEEARVKFFSGNSVPPGSEPLAQAYAGHQFGHFTMLGDGRALLLGEQITPKKERFDIQLKGSGPTAFSRAGDGRAALGPMLREYIVSEAMHALGIPTTRSLAVVSTGEVVYREESLPGAVLTRVAKSHIRVGTFEYAAGLDDVSLLKVLADYTIKRHYPELARDKNHYLGLLKAVMTSQSHLIARWMAVGFIHGVMNTDNMAISGETIDYGPCAFLDEFDLKAVFSSIDRHGRYAFGNQAHILQWNVARFAEALVPLLGDNKETAAELANETLSQIPLLFHDFWVSEMRKKLGLLKEEESDAALIQEGLEILAQHKSDFTNTFFALTTNAGFEGTLAGDAVFAAWKSKWVSRLQREGQSLESAQKIMKRHNPSIIPRNSLVQKAVDEGEKGNISFTHRLLKALSQPFEAPDEFKDLRQTPAPDPDFKTFCGT